MTSDTGSYRCYAENDAGSMKKEFSVEVVVGAKVEPDFDLVHVQSVGDSAEFSCKATGSPPPRIIWEHNGKMLQRYFLLFSFKKIWSRFISPIKS